MHREKLQIVVFFMFFLLIGFSIIVFGITTFVSETIFINNAVENTAVISDIRTSRRGGDTVYSAYVTHYVDGMEYEGLLGSFRTEIGREVKIYYNPDNPCDIRSKNHTTVYRLILIPAGGVFFLMGFIPLFGKYKRMF